GIDPDAVDVVVADGNLYLVGKRDRPRGEGQVYQQMEIDYGTFRRQIALNADVALAKAHASYDRGMLTIVLPLAQRPPAREKVTIAVTRLVAPISASRSPSPRPSRRSCRCSRSRRPSSSPSR